MIPTMRIRLSFALVISALFMSLGGSARAELPVILPHHREGGRSVTINVVPMVGSRSCTAAFFAPGHRTRTFRLSLGGPSRTLRLTTPAGTSGTWRTRVACRTGAKGPGQVGVRDATFAIEQPGKPTGTLRSGRLHVSSGPIRERPRLRQRARASEDTDTSGWKPCGSVWMSKAHVAGSGSATRISFVPTTLARTLDLTGGLLGVRSASGRIWVALNGCVKFPGLNDQQLDGIYKQMVCHIVYNLFGGAGNTWDFEAWHRDPSWAEALDYRNRCQNWGDVVGAGAEFLGQLIHSDADSRAAYFVDVESGKYVRRHILTTRAFYCLKNAGHRDITTSPLPQGFLDSQLPPGADVGDSICASPGGGTGGGSAGGGGASISLTQGPAAPSGYRYSISLHGFAANSPVSVLCFDSVTPGGFYPFTLQTDGAGNASTADQCYSGDGPDHWVKAGGVESNHVSWGGGGPPPPPPPPPPGFFETTGGVAHTWTNYTNAGGYEGPLIPSNATVQIACALEGFHVADGNPWWYRVAQAPWSGAYYVSADAFYNNGQTSGSLHGTPFVDPAVPHC
jgi:hypothetical protein